MSSRIQSCDLPVGQIYLTEAIRAVRRLSRNQRENIAFAAWVAVFLTLLFVVIRWGHP